LSTYALTNAFWNGSLELRFDPVTIAEIDGEMVVTPLVDADFVATGIINVGLQGIGVSDSLGLTTITSVTRVGNNIVMTFESTPVPEIEFKIAAGAPALTLSNGMQVGPVTGFAGYV
jgi:hypothetical protein